MRSDWDGAASECPDGQTAVRVRGVPDGLTARFGKLEGYGSSDDGLVFNSPEQATQLYVLQFARGTQPVRVQADLRRGKDGSWKLAGLSLAQE